MSDLPHEVGLTCEIGPALNLFPCVFGSNGYEFVEKVGIIGLDRRA
jgi:hypothetical protein